MGTSVEVEAYGGDEAARRAAIDEAFGAIAEVDRLMSNYPRRQRAVAREPDRGARHAVAVSDPMLSVLEAAQQVSA